jgi:endonuclease/exonuclease/phosphatase family metal-dependent hydrolase
MTLTFREVAREMDECPSPSRPQLSLTELAKAHRWHIASAPDDHEPKCPPSVSLRELAERHAHPHRRVLRLLWYNTYLIPGFNFTELFPPPFKQIVPEITKAAGPARFERSFEIGAAIRDSGYDVAALCEVFEEGSQDRIRSAFSPPPDSAAGPAGEKKVLHAGFFEQAAKELPEAPAAILNALNSMRDVAVDIVDTITFGLFSDATNAALPTIDIAGSGLLTLARGDFRVVASESEVYENQGNLFRDADAWSRKGVLLTVIDTGLGGRIELYTTHLLYGGDFGDISDAERHGEQAQQYGQLIEFIQSKHQPANFIILAADFNINAARPFYQFLRPLLEDQLGLEDVWSRYARARHGAKVGRTNDPKLCQAGGGPCNDLFCDDYAAAAVDDEGRIDYVFIQKPHPAHKLDVDVARPRRRPFRREPGREKFDEQPFMADHLGLDLRLYLYPRDPHVLATPTKGKPKDKT